MTKIHRGKRDFGEAEGGEWQPFPLQARKGARLMLLMLMAIFLPGTALLQADDSEADLVAAARSQIGKTLRYNPAYQALDYPGGDVPIEEGVCTDVVIRALRRSHGLDLQKLLHEDMKANFGKYPDIWGLRTTDRNIDHRRVPNLRRYFKRMGYALKVTREAKDYQAGDLVTCTVPPHRPHIMIVSDRTSADGVPLVIHNIGRGTREEERLFEFELTGHYRVPPKLEK